jgi:hypothetical protein
MGFWEVIDPDGCDLINRLIPWWIHNMMALLEGMPSGGEVGH